MKESRSWTSTLLGAALMLLAACYAINLAARLLMAVLPILIGVGVVCACGFIGLHVLQRRGSGW